jgi:hypothetical protein
MTTALFPVLLLATCHDQGPTNARVAFTHAPVAESQIESITPLGNLNPPDHLVPTDHIYMLLKRPKEPTPVFAPAGGSVAWIWHQPPYDPKITIRVTAKLRYYLAHVTLAPGLKPGDHVVAGQNLGVTSGNSAALDLGVIDESVRLTGFANPARYPTDTLHCAPPLRFFAEPLRSRLYSKVRREGPDKDGRIDLDVPGRLAGNWFLEGLPPADSSGPTGWPKSLSFARDVHRPSEVRIAIGGQLALAGLFAVAADAPDPADVSPESGKVAFKLFDVRAQNAPAGTLLVEMLDRHRIRIEAFPRSDAVNFTPAALAYVR